MTDHVKLAVVKSFQTVGSHSLLSLIGRMMNEFRLSLRSSLWLVAETREVNSFLFKLAKT